MTVTDIVKRTVGDRIEVSARVSRRDPLPDFPLWYRFPLEIADGIVAEGDPFLAALLPLAVHERTPLRIHAVVSEELLCGVNQIMRIWHSWDRKDGPVPVSADGVRASDHGGGETASFFSLGIDSFYTLFQNLRRERGDGRISRLILVHGFDIPLAAEGFFSGIADRSRRIADGVGIRLIPVSTNIRAIDALYSVGSRWGRYSHGAALASVGLLLQGLLKSVLVPASHTYAEPLPWGSHPLVDPLWSTESIRFRHDGAEPTRVRKTLFLADNPAVLENLRVCAMQNFMTGHDEASGHLLNCGLCEKCLRTMLTLWTVGALDRCKTFAAPFDRTRCWTLKVADDSTACFVRENVELLEKTGRDPELAARLRSLIRRDLGHWARLKHAAYRSAGVFDRRILFGAFHAVIRAKRAGRNQDTVQPLPPSNTP